MKLLTRSAPALVALALAACQPGLVASAPAPVAPAAGPVLLANQGTREATLVLSAPQAYALQATATPSPVHRWVPADIVRYDVELKQRHATLLTQFDSLATPLVLQVPVAGNGVGQATFGQLRQGAYYRAVVKAMGRINGSQGTGDLAALNTAATDDFADFDFTAANDVVPSLQRSVTIDFDGVAFSGTGAVSFGSPSPGVFVNPSAGPTATVSAPPTDS